MFFYVNLRSLLFSNLRLAMFLILSLLKTGIDLGHIFIKLNLNFKQSMTNIENKLKLSRVMNVVITLVKVLVFYVFLYRKKS